MHNFLIDDEHVTSCSYIPKVTQVDDHDFSVIIMQIFPNGERRQYPFFAERSCDSYIKAERLGYKFIVRSIHATHKG